MIGIEGYYLDYDRKNNRIIITLPQTLSTLTNTLAMVTNRRTYLTQSEEALILTTVKAIIEREEE